MSATNQNKKSIAVIGSGPAGLMAATRLAELGHHVDLYEKDASVGRKILIAGSSGLNITYSAPTIDSFLSFYRNPSPQLIAAIKEFTPNNTLNFFQSLGLETFVGTSNRCFTKDMKGAKPLSLWTKKLHSLGVTDFCEHTLTKIESLENQYSLHFESKLGTVKKNYSFVILALGGPSYQPKGFENQMNKIFEDLKISKKDFISSNCGFEVEWSQKLLKECEGKALKNILLKSNLGSHLGDIVITQYGIEGTPVYYVGIEGTAWIDLRPQKTEAELFSKLKSSTENLSPIRRAQKFLNLTEAEQSLLFHLPEKKLSTLEELVKILKNLPIDLKKRRPLVESISASGGIEFTELDENLMVKKHPGLFIAGEVLDWDAPTGGFLFQACLATGYAAANSIHNKLQKA